MSYDVFNILIGKRYVWIRNTSNISVLSEYLRRIVISSYVYSAYCFVCRNGYLLDVPKAGKFELRWSRLLWDSALRRSGSKQHKQKG